MYEQHEQGAHCQAGNMDLQIDRHITRSSFISILTIPLAMTPYRVNSLPYRAAVHPAIY